MKWLKILWPYLKCQWICDVQRTLNENKIVIVIAPAFLHLMICSAITFAHFQWASRRLLRCDSGSCSRLQLLDLASIVVADLQNSYWLMTHGGITPTSKRARLLFVQHIIRLTTQFHSLVLHLKQHGIVQILYHLQYQMLSGEGVYSCQYCSMCMSVNCCKDYIVITLLSPSLRRWQKALDICNYFVQEYSVKFNWNKRLNIYICIGKRLWILYFISIWRGEVKILYMCRAFG